MKPPVKSWQCRTAGHPDSPGHEGCTGWRGYQNSEPCDCECHPEAVRRLRRARQTELFPEILALIGGAVFLVLFLRYVIWGT